MAKMGMDFGLPLPTSSRACKRKFRWLLKIDDVCASGINTLPPCKGSRPTLSFREMEAKHVVESIYYPARPEWKPINLVLYDVVTGGNHPVFSWIQKVYNPQSGSWVPVGSSDFMKDARLELYDGCGSVIESWVFENAWPQVADFSDLDMGNQELVTCDISLRYSRAYVA